MKKLITLSAAALLCAAGAFAALSSEYADWAKSPVQHLMTKQEASEWKAISTDAAAKDFVDLFWAKRDPSPATPRNEVREEFDRRVAYADEHFAEKKLRGALTERGRALILFGAPKKIERSGSQRASSSPAGISEDPANQPMRDDNEVHIWTYEGDDATALFGVGKATLRFADRYGTGEFHLDRGSSSEFAKASQVAVNRVITQPSLTKAPSFAPVPPPAPAAPTVVTDLTTESLKSAVADFKAAAKNPYEKSVYGSWGEYITGAGKTFVPVLLFANKSAGLTADQNVTFFGVVQDAAGANVLAFEDPAKVTASKDDFFVDKTLDLPAGKYKAYIGVADAGKVLGLTAVDLDVTGKLDKDATAVSNLILSNNVYPLTQAQMADDPFAFGGIKVVPKADRIFKPADELWYFFEMRNPGVPEPAPVAAADPAAAPAAAPADPAATAAAEPMPKLQVKMDVEGVTTAGQKVKKSAPPMEIQAIPMKGVPGHYGVGNAIPLTSFKPGDYTFTVKVIDTVKKASYTLTDKFKVVE
jgi:GWxTD domain-containing protein